MMTRRGFLTGLTSAGVAGAVGFPRPAGAEPPPETTTLRLTVQSARGVCTAPKYVAEELLGAEGFTNVQYVREEGFLARMKLLASGETDIEVTFGGPLILRIDAGDPIVVLAGAHVGCFELFGTDRVRAVRDLKGKTVAVFELGGTQHVYLASIVAYVGLDPRRDVNWVAHPPAQAMRLLAEGRIDAYLGTPPEPQELRRMKIGHVVLNSSADRPWSQYFCCMVVGNRGFVRERPAATKRAVRAMLKAADLCSLEPARVARLLVDKGYTRNYEYALQTMKEVPYGKCREYGPEDTIRFYALRLHEAGMIKSSPQKIIAQGADWRFLNELKKELKG